ncbi:MAG: OsmC family protein [Trueperaceae bacterium]
MVLDGQQRIRLEMTGEGFEIASEGIDISPYHLLGASLASCTALMFESWAPQTGVDLAPLTISVSWEMAEERPMRVRSMAMELEWPGLPAERVETAERVADLCPIHATLERSAEISRRIVAA